MHKPAINHLGHQGIVFISPTIPHPICKFPFPQTYSFGSFSQDSLIAAKTSFSKLNKS